MNHPQPHAARLALRHIPLLVSLALAAGSVLAAGPSVTLERPTGGWRADERNNEFVQTVNYPANRVNLREGVSAAAQIRGHIAGAAKAEPGELIVNGVAMPLEVDEGGHYARPYAFAAGSNSLEVRSPDRKHTRRVQFVDVGRGARPLLRVLLSWDSPGSDLDLHVITPSGQHCYYGNRVIQGGGALDVDVTTGYGPEIFAAPRPERGTWQIYVNYYGGYGGAIQLTTAQIAVITGEGTPSETQRIFRVPLRASGALQHVTSFSVL